MTGGLRIGTRASPLALWQTERVRHLLRAAGHASHALEITTTGDAVLDVPLARIGSVALFTRQLDDALLAGRIDAAVHSLKDLPTRLPAGIVLAAVGERADVRDALVGHPGVTWATLPPGAIVATGSLRRRAQLLRARPDLVVVDVRGNVQTRLRHLDDHADWSATMLAVAGLERLGLEARISDRLDPAVMLPAPSQGALGVTVREDDQATIEVLRAVMHDPATGIATSAERGFLRALDGGCQVPVAALATVEAVSSGWRVSLRGRVVSLDGRTAPDGGREAVLGSESEATSLGEALAKQLLAEGAGAVLDAVRQQALREA
jgi:hydroxymethylbilane synthase